MHVSTDPSFVLGATADPALGTVPDVDSRTAEAEAYQHIQSAIRRGLYAAGARLMPEAIALEIGTSRMPVREAIRRLAAEGLVTIRPNRGVVVNGLDLLDMREVFEMRAVLEGLAAGLAVTHMDPATIRQLEVTLDRIDDRSHIQPDWTEAHRHFHETLCTGSKRPRLLRQIASLHVLVEPHMRLWAQQSGRPPSARADHQALIDALRSGDAQRCETAMRDHVMATVQDLAPLMPAPAVAPRGRTARVPA